MRVVATAGHVDHGKSTLVRVLTGTDPDRWEIEKSRGMTIDLGFASTTLASGEEIGFVDVPGHYKFVKKMLAGISGVDACLFVVDANEGWMPQSEEHLRILELLQIPTGVVALTKVADLDDDLRELAALELADHLEGTFLARSEVVLVDALAGVGMDELCAALDRLVRSTPPAPDRGRPRLWVDRAFAIRGVGTVATGTLTGGRLSVNDELVLEPGGHRVRVRNMESHGKSVIESEPGRRLALNLMGVAYRDLVRGDVVIRPGQWHTTSVFDASLRVLSRLGRPLRNKGAYAAYIGTGDYQVRLRILGSNKEIDPGDEGHARLWLKGRVPLALLPGDRYVLRELGRDETVGGGEILDVEPILSPKHAAPSRSLKRVVDERGWVKADHLEQITGERVTATIGGWVVAPAARARIEEAVRLACRKAGALGVDVATLLDVERALVDAGIPGVILMKSRVFDESSVTDEISQHASRVLSALTSNLWSPPELLLSDRAALRELEGRGLACQAGTVWFSSAAVDAATLLLSKFVEGRAEGFTVSEACRALDTSRKFGLPLLGYLDVTGVTHRRGDLRVAGPVMIRRAAANPVPREEPLD